MSAAQDDIIPKEKGVQKVQSEGIVPFLTFIESGEREFFKAKDFVTLYDLIFKCSIQRDPYNWSETMYELYTHSILDYLLSKVQPAFVNARSQYEVAFLKEWRTRWANQKLIVQGLAKLFMYLDRFYTPNCMPSDEHEILTNRGFLKLDQFESAMNEKEQPLLVACYVPATNSLEYHPPVGVVKLQGTHQLVSFTSPNEKKQLNGAEPNLDMSLLCTLNHTMWAASTEHKECADWTGDAAQFQKLSAGKVLSKAIDDCLIRFQAMADNGVHSPPATLPFVGPLGLNTADEIDAFLFLYGCWMVDGGMDFATGAITFNSVKPDDADTIDLVLARLPLDEARDGFMRHEDDWGVTYSICNPNWFAYFAREYHGEYAGGAEWLAEQAAVAGESLPDAAKAVSGKSFYAWVWRHAQLNRDQLRAMLAGMQFADASQTVGEAAATASIAVSTKELRDELVIVALHAGYSTTVTEHADDGASANGVSVIPAQSHWRVHYSDNTDSGLPTLHGERDVSEVKDWQGTVWCTTVAHADHLIVARRAPEGEKPFKPVIIGNSDGILSLKDQGYKSYKEQIFDQFAPIARQAILNAIEKERNDEEQDRQLLQEAVLVFVEMGYNFNKKLTVYTGDLERHIVDHAGLYYQRQSRIWMDSDSTPVYLEKVEKVMQQETARVAAYLNRSTQEPLQKECYMQLLKTHQKELLRKKTGLFHLLSINAVDDLARLYRLYKNYDSDLEPIAEMFEEFISREGTAVVDAAKAAATAAPKEEEKDGAAAASSSAAPASAAADANHALVRNLIGLHAQYNDLVTIAFEKAQIMQKSLKKAFEEFINKDNRVSKLLAKFVNDVLKKGSKVNVRDVESTLDNIVFLYGYISEKDVFEAAYQSHLANRLLLGSCESEHSEKSMIAKLKTECGYQVTNHRIHKCRWIREMKGSS